MHLNKTYAFFINQNIFRNSSSLLLCFPGLMNKIYALFMNQLGKAFINIFNVCAIFLNMLIFPLKQFFYKIHYSTCAKYEFVTSF